MKKPMSQATTTCDKECCRNSMRLLPTTPEIKRVRQSHHSGSKPKMSEKANKAPTTPPIAAEWTDTFQPTLMNAQNT